ncbi:L-fucose/L-arabinose isomerase family protein [Candidatus Poribacteria bacterium]
MGNKMTFGLIVGTRGFFSPQLAAAGRKQLTAKLDNMGYEYAILPEGATPTGAVETLDDAQKCARLFQERRDDIQGIIVALPNFGDELGIVNALKQAKLDVPVLVQASDDDIDKVDVANRRDSFCGKLSVCNNLYQYDIPFTDTTYHTCAIESDVFAGDIEFFASVCRVVNGLRNARIGAIGARPAAFQTMRFSEKLLQGSGITVVPVDLSEIIFAAQSFDDDTPAVQQKLAAIRDYGKIPDYIEVEKILKQAKLSIAIDNWVAENDIQAAGVQCWTSVQENYGCAACLSMSMLGESLTPCACEVDVAGVISMYALTLATKQPAALLDWNNNYGDDRDMCVCTHCGNYPKSFINSPVEISNLDILGASLGEENCFGAVKGRVAPGPMTYFRISTDDREGKIKTYLGEGEFTDDPFGMSGGIAVCRVPHLQLLMKHMCKNGFEHHVGMVRSRCAAVVQEAVDTYMGWDLYCHQ